MPFEGVVVAVAAGAELVGWLEVEADVVEDRVLLLLLDTAVDVLVELARVVSAPRLVAVGELFFGDLLAREPPTPPPTAAAIITTSMIASGMKNILRRRPQYRLSLLRTGASDAAALCFSFR